MRHLLGEKMLRMQLLLPPPLLLLLLHGVQCGNLLHGAWIVLAAACAMRSTPRRVMGERRRASTDAKRGPTTRTIYVLLRATALLPLAW